MPKCHLIVCEKTGQWATALCVIAPPAHPPVVEIRSLSVAQDALAAAPASFVALVATPDNLASVITLMQEGGRRYSLARFVGLLNPEDRALEAALREAGAIDVICSVLDLPRLSKLAARHAARTPQPEASIAQWVQARMPWKFAAITKT